MKNQRWREDNYYGKSFYDNDIEGLPLGDSPSILSYKYNEANS